MKTRYKDICKSYDCKAKVFTHMTTNLENQIGSPDLVIVFTNTCSHKMLGCVNSRTNKHRIPVRHVHTASVSALKNVLDKECRELRNKS